MNNEDVDIKMIFFLILDFFLIINHFAILNRKREREIKIRSRKHSKILAEQKDDEIKKKDYLLLYLHRHKLQQLLIILSKTKTHTRIHRNTYKKIQTNKGSSK